MVTIRVTPDRFGSNSRVRNPLALEVSLNVLPLRNSMLLNGLLASTAIFGLSLYWI